MRSAIQEVGHTTITARDWRFDLEAAGRKPSGLSRGLTGQASPLRFHLLRTYDHTDYFGVAQVVAKLHLRMFERIRPYLLPLSVAATIVVCLYAFSPNFRPVSGPAASPYGGDFLQEWVGGWIVRAGDRGRFYDVQYAYRLEHDEPLVGFHWNADEYLPMVYPPFYYLLVSPLSLVSFHAATWLWAGLMVAALARRLVCFCMSLRRRTDWQ